MTPRAATAGRLGHCAPREILHGHSPGPPVIRLDIRRSPPSLSGLDIPPFDQ